MISRVGLDGSLVELSDDERHRFVLTRPLGKGVRRIGMVGLNPSKADEKVNDNTIVRSMGFASREHGSVLVMANLYPFRATKPRDLWAHLLQGGDDPEVDAEHRQRREHALGPCSIVILAFGNFTGCPRRLQHTVRDEARQLVQRLLLQHRTVWCLARTHDGWPGHPLYLRKDAPLLPYTLPPEMT